jgi:hypothetical protein
MEELAGLNTYKKIRVHQEGPNSLKAFTVSGMVLMAGRRVKALVSKSFCIGYVKRVSDEWVDNILRM